MNKKTITYWQDGEYWLGYINEYPEYVTQGVSIEELIENLKDIFHDISNELIPGKRKSMELELA
jgi:predicted RNase H-like HicB family nuclease